MTTQQNITLSIIIPAYQEESTIGGTLEKLAAYIQKMDIISIEVIVAIGQGTDRTYEVAVSKSGLFGNLVVINDIVPHTKGNNVQTAILAARGKYCLYMDADLATPLHHIDEALQLLKTYDIVNGQRGVGKIHRGHRKFISTFGNLLVRLILLPGFKDTQCGFKAFRTAAAKQLFAKQKIESWGFDIEILALAKQMRYSIAHLPIPDWQDKEGGSLNAGPQKAFGAAFNTFLDLLRIRLNLMKGGYNLRSLPKARAAQG
jgi:glycosyltransferase involved in cell wall biosynthesis